MPETVKPSAFHRLWDLGYHRLVPIIPPDADVFEKSSIARRMAKGDDSRGKVPGVRRSDGTWQGLSLVAMESQESDLDTWAEMGAGVGIKTGEGLIALDIDTIDTKAARALYELAAQILGPAAVRFGRKPKCLMLYEAPTDTAYRQVMFSTEIEDKARVEILSEGRQFVADGIHPVTGKPYAWPNGTPRRDALTRITAEQLDDFLRAAADALDGSVAANAGAKDAPDQKMLQAPSWDALKGTLALVHNTSKEFPTRDAYVKVAYAVRASAPDGYDLEARDLYLDWCERWEDGDNDLGIAIEDWERAKPPFRVGYQFLQSHAPEAFFADVSTANLSEKEKVDEIFKNNKEATKRPPYALMTIDDVFSLPPPEFLIDRHIPQEGFGILFGDPGAGKSFVALDMALHIAYALDDWHGDAIRRKGRDGVLYIAGEGAQGFGNRIRAWQKDRLLPVGTAPDFRFLFQPCNFMRHEDVTRLLETVEIAHPQPLALIVVDTVSRAIPGADENLQKDMTQFVAACDALRHKTGAFVLGIHHTSKAGEMRGSSVFLGQADVVLRLNRKKGHTVAYLHCDKQKDAPDGWSEAYRMAEVTVADNQSSLVPTRLEAGTEATGGVLNADVAAQMLDALEAAWWDGKPLSPQPRAVERYAPRILAEQFGIAAGEVADVLSLWERTGQIEIAKTQRQKGYRVLRDSTGPGIFG